MKPRHALIAGLVAFFAFMVSGCGPEPMAAEEQEIAVSKVTAELQELATRTYATMEYGEYIIVLRRASMEYAKVSQRLDRSVADRIDFAFAPFQAAYNDWDMYLKGKLEVPDDNIILYLNSHWEIGRERVRELASEYPPAR